MIPAGVVQERKIKEEKEAKKSLVPGAGWSIPVTKVDNPMILSQSILSWLHVGCLWLFYGPWIFSDLNSTEFALRSVGRRKEAFN